MDKIKTINDSLYQGNTSPVLVRVKIYIFPVEINMAISWEIWKQSVSRPSNTIFGYLHNDSSVITRSLVPLCSWEFYFIKMDKENSEHLQQSIQWFRKPEQKLMKIQSQKGHISVNMGVKLKGLNVIFQKMEEKEMSFLICGERYLTWKRSGQPCGKQFPSIQSQSSEVKKDLLSPFQIKGTKFQKNHRNFFFHLLTQEKRE